MSLPPGTRIGPYNIVGVLAVGGMSVVYEAEQVGLGRRIALKILPDHVSAQKEAVARFEHEAEAAARLDHPNIVRIIERGFADEHFYIAMDLVKGPTLADEIRSRALRMKAGELRFDRQHVEWAVGMLLPILRALAYAHERGVVHRDVKPQNVLLGEDGRPRLADFGIARVDLGAGVTLEGQVLGTPAYLSPELAQPGLHRVDHRTDVYSSGAMLYEMLSLELPFAGADSSDMIRSIVNRAPPPLRGTNPHLPRDMETIVLKAMEKFPDDRYTTAAQFADDLERFINFAEIVARPAGPARKIARFLRKRRVEATAVGAAVVVAAGALLGARYFVDPAPPSIPVRIRVDDVATVRSVKLDDRGEIDESTWEDHGRTSRRDDTLEIDLPYGDYLFVAQCDESDRFAETYVVADPEFGETKYQLHPAKLDELGPMKAVSGGDYEIGDERLPNARPRGTRTIAAFRIDAEVATWRDVQDILSAERRARLEALVEKRTVAYDEPAMSLSLFEAARYVATKGKRLPTEFELEAAASGSAGAPAAIPWSESEVRPMWTASRHLPYGDAEELSVMQFSRAQWVYRGTLPNRPPIAPIEARQSAPPSSISAGVRGVRSAVARRPSR